MIWICFAAKPRRCDFPIRSTPFFDIGDRGKPRSHMKSSKGQHGFCIEAALPFTAFQEARRTGLPESKKSRLRIQQVDAVDRNREIRSRTILGLMEIAAGDSFGIGSKSTIRVNVCLVAFKLLSVYRKA